MHASTPLRRTLSFLMRDTARLMRRRLSQIDEYGPRRGGHDRVAQTVDAAGLWRPGPYC